MSGWLRMKKSQPFVASNRSIHCSCETSKPPVILYLRGDVGVTAKKPIAVVGTRQATGYGARATRAIVSELVAHGSTIVSGFMYGIDALAHETAIQGGGKTVAVLGFGFGTMYPPDHQAIFERWVKLPGVLFVSQFRPNTIAKPGNFPRNHVVAGLSLATLRHWGATVNLAPWSPLVLPWKKVGRFVQCPDHLIIPILKARSYWSIRVPHSSFVLAVRCWAKSAISGVMTASSALVPQIQLSAAQQQHSIQSSRAWAPWMSFISPSISVLWL